MPRDEQLDRLRVTNQQRDNAVAELREAMADGRIDFDEFESRLPRLMGARTRRDLVEDLSDLVEPARMDTVITNETVLGEGPGFSWDNPVVIGQQKETRRQLGRWHVPPFLEVHANEMAYYILDFTEAVTATPVIDIVIVGGSSVASVLVIVPDGWGVSTQGLQMSGQNYSTSRVRTRPLKGNPRIVLSGSTAGTVNVRNPNSWDERRQRKFIAKQPSRGEITSG